MTTYGPDPDVPTAAVLPADVCVIAPPVTATSTVLRIPNCPVIRWTASRCREPSVLAFAVAVTLGVDAGVIGPVYRAVFRRCPHHSASVERRNIAIGDVAVQGHRGGVCTFRLAMELEGTGCTDKRSERRDCSARLDAACDLLRCVDLPATQQSCICSEADVRRERAEGRRRYWSEFPWPCGACHAYRR